MTLKPLGILLLALPLTAATVRIIQTNSAGDDVSVIDPSTNKVVGKITGIEVNHGAAASPDGSRIYISNEAESTLDVVDGKTFKVIKNIPLSDHPNNLGISKDGKRVYVAIARGAGAVDVIDTVSMEKVKTIPVKGPQHNTYVTPDGKFVVSGSVRSKVITVIDQKTEEPVWTMELDKGIRPMAFSTNPDGSTKWMFVQISDFHGFVVIDFATRKEVTRIKLPDSPDSRELIHEGGNISHGMAVTADQKTLVVNSTLNSSLYMYSLPDLKPSGRADVGVAPDWVTLTPDGKRAYVANAGQNSVSVIDLATKKEVTRIPVGEVPKRNYTAVY